LDRGALCWKGRLGASLKQETTQHLNITPCKNLAHKAKQIYISILGVIIVAFLVHGMVLAFLMPPFQVPDENVHWLTAFARVERLFASLSGTEPVSCSSAYSLPQHFRVSDIRFHRDNKMRSGSFADLSSEQPGCDAANISYGGVITYPGVVIARASIFNENTSPVNALLVFYLSRLFQGIIIFVVLLRIFLISRLSSSTPIGILSISFFTLAPIFVQQSFSINADTICFAASLILAGYLVLSSGFSKLDYVLITILSICACHTKPVMFPLIPGALLAGDLIRIYTLAEEKSGKRFSTHFLVSAGITLCCLIAAVATYLSQPAYNNPFPTRHLSPGSQLSYILENPMVVASYIFKNISIFCEPVTLTSSLGWLDLKTSKMTQGLWRYSLYAIVVFESLVMLFIIATSVRRNFIKLVTWEAGRIGAVFLFAVVCIVVSFAIIPVVLYLFWTPVGARNIQGIQARYYIPVLIPALGLWFAMGRICRLHDSVSICPPVYKRYEALRAVVIFSLMSLLVIGLCCMLTSLCLDIAIRYW
jgi:uncharacterized membrane protein